MENLVVLHRKGKRDLALDLASPFVWKTCLRQIAFLKETDTAQIELHEHDEFLRGPQAYEFLLQIICGLQSPVLGETEVMGQFKDFIYSDRFSGDAWAYGLRRFGQQLLTDAKTIRTNHLKGLGSHSYGSLARRHLKGFKNVSFLGAGQLVTEMVPWFAKISNVTIHARTLAKALVIQGQYPVVKVARLAEAGGAVEGETAMIVAAPMSAIEIADWTRMSGLAFSRIIDLRGDAGEDVLEISGVQTVKLPELFAELEQFRSEMTQRLSSAHEEIAVLTRTYNQRMECRPFGWDDLCA